MISTNSYNTLFERCKNGFNNIYGELAIDLVIKNKIIELFPDNLLHIGIDGQMEDSEAGYSVAVTFNENGEDFLRRIHFAFDLSSFEMLLTPTVSVDSTVKIEY
jgi:hypothetical protein